MANKLKLEAETVKARMEHEYRMKEIEISDMGAGGDAETNPNINNNSSRSAGIKALKLPPFNEDKDDLDAYLIDLSELVQLLKCVKSTGQHSWLGYYRVKPWMYINDSQMTRLMTMCAKGTVIETIPPN